MAKFSVSSVPFLKAISYTLEQLSLSHLSLKDKQRSAIRAVYQGRDACLLTRYRKSLCYQTLPFVLDFKNDSSNSAVAVVSPLIALMKDQVCELKKKGMKASVVTSSRLDTHSHSRCFSTLFLVETIESWKDLPFDVSC